MHERCTGMNAATSPIVSIHQFKITLPTNIEFDISLHADGQLVDSVLIQAGEIDEILGAYKSAHSILPFKFREIQLVGSILTCAKRPRLERCTRRTRNKDDRTQSLWLSDARHHKALNAGCERGLPSRTCLGAQQESGVASYRVCYSSLQSSRISPGHHCGCYLSTLPAWEMRYPSNPTITL